MAKQGELETRVCGSVHPEGAVCTRVVYVEPGCCMEKVWHHEGPHVARMKDGTVTHMWEAVLTVKDLPKNAYQWDDDDVPPVAQSEKVEKIA